MLTNIFFSKELKLAVAGDDSAVHMYTKEVRQGMKY